MEVFLNNRDVKSRLRAEIREDQERAIEARKGRVKKHLTKMMLMNDMKLREEAMLAAESSG